MCNKQEQRLCYLFVGKQFISRCALMYVFALVLLLSIVRIKTCKKLKSMNRSLVVRQFREANSTTGFKLRLHLGFPTCTGN